MIGDRWGPLCRGRVVNWEGKSHRISESEGTLETPWSSSSQCAPQISSSGLIRNPLEMQILRPYTETLGVVPRNWPFISDNSNDC